MAIPRRALTSAVRVERVDWSLGRGLNPRLRLPARFEFPFATRPRLKIIRDASRAGAFELKQCECEDKEDERDRDENASSNRDAGMASFHVAPGGSPDGIFESS